MADTVVLHDTFSTASGNLTGHAPDVTPAGEAWASANRWLFGSGRVVPDPGFSSTLAQIDLTSPAGAGLYFMEMILRIIDTQAFTFDIALQERDTFSTVTASIALDTPGVGQYRLAGPSGTPTTNRTTPSTTTDIVLRVEWNSATGDVNYFLDGVNAFGSAVATGVDVATPGTTVLRLAFSTTGFPPDGTSPIAILDYKFGTYTNSSNFFLDEFAGSAGSADNRTPDLGWASSNWKTPLGGTALNLNGAGALVSTGGGSVFDALAYPEVWALGGEPVVAVGEFGWTATVIFTIQASGTFVVHVTFGLADSTGGYDRSIQLSVGDSGGVVAFLIRNDPVNGPVLSSIITGLSRGVAYTATIESVMDGGTAKYTLTIEGVDSVELTTPFVNQYIDAMDLAILASSTDTQIAYLQLAQPGDGPEPPQPGAFWTDFTNTYEET